MSAQDTMFTLGIIGLLIGTFFHLLGEFFPPATYFSKIFKYVFLLVGFSVFIVMRVVKLWGGGA